MTSSCTRLAVWIISEIMAIDRCAGSRSLRVECVWGERQKEEDHQYQLDVDVAEAIE